MKTFLCFCLEPIRVQSLPGGTPLDAFTCSMLGAGLLRLVLRVSCSLHTDDVSSGVISSLCQMRQRNACL